MYRQILSFLVSILLFSATQGQCVQRTPVNGDLGYKSRGNTEKDSRCEGLVPYSISKLPGKYVSLTIGKVLYNKRTDELIEIFSPKLKSSQDIVLRGRGQSDLGYEYFLDCQIKPNTKKVIPVKDVIDEGKVDPRNYGIYAYLANDSAKLVPIAFKSKLNAQTKGVSDTLYIRFKPEGTFRDVKYSIRRKGQSEALYASTLPGMFDSNNLIEMKIPMSKLGLKKGEEAEFEFAFSTTQNDSSKKDNYNSQKTILICNEFTYK